MIDINASSNRIKKTISPSDSRKLSYNFSFPAMLNNSLFCILEKIYPIKMNKENSQSK